MSLYFKNFFLKRVILLLFSIYLISSFNRRVWTSLCSILGGVLEDVLSQHCFVFLLIIEFQHFDHQP